MRGDGPCEAGTYVAEGEPRVCTDCSYGTFSTEPNAEACNAWTAHECDWDEASVGTGTMDATCQSRAFATDLPQGVWDWSTRVVAIDSEDNVLVGGGWVPALSTVGFLAKLGPAGEVLWIRELENALEDLVVDSGDSVYSISNREAGGTSGVDSVLTKHGLDGKPERRIDIGGPGIDEALTIAIGPDDAIYVGGRTEGDLFAANQGGFDAFVAKFDADRGLVWGVQFGTSEDDQVSDCAVGTDGTFALTTYSFGTSVDEVQKRSTIDGGQIWSIDVESRRVALDENGDVYGAAGAVLYKYAGDDGTEEWSWDVPQDGEEPASVTDIAANPNGLVAVVLEGTTSITGAVFSFGYLVTSDGEPFDEWLAWWDQTVDALALGDDAVVVVTDYYGPEDFGYYGPSVLESVFQYP